MLLQGCCRCCWQVVLYVKIFFAAVGVVHIPGMDLVLLSNKRRTSTTVDDLRIVFTGRRLLQLPP
jgi:hypothetical protein